MVDMQQLVEPGFVSHISTNAQLLGRRDMLAGRSDHQRIHSCMRAECHRTFGAVHESCERILGVRIVRH